MRLRELISVCIASRRPSIELSQSCRVLNIAVFYSWSDLKISVTASIPCNGGESSIPLAMGTLEVPSVPRSRGEVKCGEVDKGSLHAKHFQDEVSTWSWSSEKNVLVPCDEDVHVSLCLTLKVVYTKVIGRIHYIISIAECFAFYYIIWNVIK